MRYNQKEREDGSNCGFSIMMTTDFWRRQWLWSFGVKRLLHVRKFQDDRNRSKINFLRSPYHGILCIRVPYSCWDHFQPPRQRVKELRLAWVLFLSDPCLPADPDCGPIVGCIWFHIKQMIRTWIRSPWCSFVHIPLHSLHQGICFRSPFDTFLASFQIGWYMPKCKYRMWRQRLWILMRQFHSFLCCRSFWKKGCIDFFHSIDRCSRKRRDNQFPNHPDIRHNSLPKSWSYWNPARSQFRILWWLSCKMIFHKHSFWPFVHPEHSKPSHLKWWIFE